MTNSGKEREINGGWEKKRVQMTIKGIRIKSTHKGRIRRGWDASGKAPTLLLMAVRTILPSIFLWGTQTLERLNKGLRKSYKWGVALKLSLHLSVPKPQLLTTVCRANWRANVTKRRCRWRLCGQGDNCLSGNQSLLEKESSGPADEEACLSFVSNFLENTSRFCIDSSFIDWKLNYNHNNCSLVFHVGMR